MELLLTFLGEAVSSLAVSAWRRDAYRVVYLARGRLSMTRKRHVAPASPRDELIAIDGKPQGDLRKHSLGKLRGGRGR